MPLKWGCSDGQGYFSTDNHKAGRPASNKGGSDLDPDRQELKDFFGTLIEKTERAGKEKAR